MKILVVAERKDGEIRRVSSDNPAVRMPLGAAKLSDREIGLLRGWIEQGAKWEGHWAFVAPRRPQDLFQELTELVRVQQMRLNNEQMRQLAEGDREGFAFAFDARLIQRQPQLFAARKAKLFRWIEESILPVERLGLGPAIGRASLVCVDPAEGMLRVRWTWPTTWNTQGTAADAGSSDQNRD